MPKPILWTGRRRRLPTLRVSQLPNERLYNVVLVVGKFDKAGTAELLSSGVDTNTEDDMVKTLIIDWLMRKMGDQLRRPVQIERLGCQAYAASSLERAAVARQRPGRMFASTRLVQTGHERQLHNAHCTLSCSGLPVRLLTAKGFVTWYPKEA